LSSIEEHLLTIAIVPQVAIVTLPTGELKEADHMAALQGEYCRPG